MRELFALVRYHATAAVRGRGARLLGLLALGALGLTAFGPWAEAPSPAGLTLAILGVVGFVAFGLAGWAGTLLPEGRTAGTEAWLATTAPGAAQRRGAAVVTGIAFVLGSALLGGAFAAVILPLRRPDASVRTASSLSDVAGDRVRSAAHGGAPLRFVLGEGGGVRTLEVEVGRWYRRAEARGMSPDAHWLVSGSPSRRAATYGRTLRFEVPAGATEVALENRSDDLDLVIRSARILGAPRSRVLALLWAGLLLGAAAACLVPVAVFVSRFTSGPTAAAVAFVLALAGVLRPVLRDLSGSAEGASGRAALHILEAAGRLAPDLGRLDALGEFAAGRAIGGAVGASLPVFFLYAAIGIVLVLVPAPRALTGRGGA